MSVRRRSLLPSRCSTAPRGCWPVVGPDQLAVTGRIAAEDGAESIIAAYHRTISKISARRRPRPGARRGARRARPSTCCRCKFPPTGQAGRFPTVRRESRRSQWQCGRLNAAGWRPIAAGRDRLQIFRRTFSEPFNPLVDLYHDLSNREQIALIKIFT